MRKECYVHYYTRERQLTFLIFSFEETYAQLAYESNYTLIWLSRDIVLKAQLNARNHLNLIQKQFSRSSPSSFCSYYQLLLL